jgi:hypothetical protein
MDTRRRRLSFRGEAEKSFSKLGFLAGPKLVKTPTESFVTPPAVVVESSTFAIDGLTLEER